MQITAPKISGTPRRVSYTISEICLEEGISTTLGQPFEGPGFIAYHFFGLASKLFG